MALTFYARTGSNSAKNPALNLTGDPALQITFLAQSADGSRGDMELDANTGGVDPDTMIEIGGQTYSFSFTMEGTMPTTKSDGANQVPDQFEGDPVIVVTVFDYPSECEVTRLAFLPESDATQAEMDSFGNGAIDVQNVDSAPPATPICLASGARVMTPRGLVPVEELAEGDLVCAADGPPQPIRWIGRSRHRWPGGDPAARPAEIAAHAFGPGRPARTLRVSPQHKMAICGARLSLDHGLDEMLAPAIGLVGHPGVRNVTEAQSVTYHHLLLARHGLIFVDGVTTESFYPGPQALAMLAPMQRLRLAQHVPGLARGARAAYGPMALPVLSRRETAMLARQGLISLVAEDEAAGVAAHVQDMAAA